MVDKIHFDSSNPAAFFKNLSRAANFHKWGEEKSISAAVLQIGLVEEWLADELEEKGFDSLKDVRDFVISRLQPPEKRTLALKEFHDCRLKMNESPRDAAERMKRLIRAAMPEAENETIVLD